MNRNYHVIGLTGQSGAGKTTVSKVFSENGFTIIDADIISRKVVRKGCPCLVELAEAFGSDILLENGELDRKRLGGIVFSDSEKLRQLNGICYPYIIYEIIQSISKYAAEGARFILLDAPTLFESNADELCDLIISVTAKEFIRLERIIKRDNISPEAAHKRFNSQYSEQFFISHSDFVIKNNKSAEMLKAKAEDVCNKIKEYYNAQSLTKQAQS